MGKDIFLHEKSIVFLKNHVLKEWSCQKTISTYLKGRDILKESNLYPFS